MVSYNKEHLGKKEHVCWKFVYKGNLVKKMQMNQKFIEKPKLKEMLVTPKLFSFESFFQKGFKTSHIF